jgi:phage protein D
MDFQTFAERHESFYVPAFVVNVGDLALTQTLAIPVSQVEVDLSLGAAGRFSFTVPNTFSIEERKFLSAYGEPVLDTLKFGASVEIKIGYGDHSRLPTMLTGIITEITTGFAEGSTPELQVSGYDNLFPMTLGKRSKSWKDARDSDIVSLLAGEYNLATDIATTKEQHAQVEQNQESDFEFVKKLAGRNHFEFYVTPKGALHFAPPRDREGGIVTLLWGQSLLSFKPEGNLAAQVAEVHVYGWDSDKKKAIVGKAAAGEESGYESPRKSGGQILRSALKKPPVLEVRQPVFTEAEAKRRAEAILNDHAKKFLTGEAECLGLPEIQPDRNVTLGNLGEPFSKTYYVQQTTHKYDSNGYRTRLKVKETSL